MFIPRVKIKIGNYLLKRVHSVVIERNIFNIVQRCTIKLPTYFYDNNRKTKLIGAIAIGDMIAVTLLYEGVYEGLEFEGFVTNIEEGLPITVNCEDFMWLFSQQNINKSWKKTTLRSIIDYLLTFNNLVELDSEILDINLSPFYIKNESPLGVFQKLSGSYGLTIYLKTNNKLHIGLAYANTSNTVNYTLPIYNGNKGRVNVISHNLKYKRTEDKKIKIKVIHFKEDNTKIEVEAGDKDGEQRTLYNYDISDPVKLKEWAESEILKYRYEGFEGEVISFLIPYAEPAMIANIVDMDYNRNGNYFIESVRTTINRGVEREIGLGIKL